SLYVATDDPSKQASLKEIQFHTGLNTYPIVVETDKLTTLIDRLFTLKENQSLSEYINEVTNFDDITNNEVTEYDISKDAPIVKFVNKILLDAIKQRASDIHFEPFVKEYRIRYRQDSILHEVANPPISLSKRITARIKVMSNLDISERRVPQDGRFKMQISKSRSIDFRISTCPTVGGEKVAIRILDPDTAKLSIDTLGLNPIQKEHFIHAIARPQGMILVTGPTGSGKTVSLYAALNMLNTKEVNISTAEDPVESIVTGINQVNINPKTGLTFSSVLRSFLRQDPDIIMVGEIRDLETAEIAIKAAQTGHLVLSTLHTNSAAETLNRLVNMGIPTFNIASSITLIMAQRLVRKLCVHCRELDKDFTKQDLLGLGFNETDLEKIQLYKAAGCPKCIKGYHGRIGLFEVLPMSNTLRELIMSGGNSLEILKIAQAEGMSTVYQSGLEKVKQGITTLKEVSRVTVD
ncbi:type IV-A pilus assembly ATPase PilB, partial [Legionella sp.]|uniref:type IV-A pilus assembly ATPase PilB n=1 Tax=Legionella sp. TaxID=459 RepID=UPI003CB0934F